MSEYRNGSSLSGRSSAATPTRIKPARIMDDASPGKLVSLMSVASISVDGALLGSGRFIGFGIVERRRASRRPNIQMSRRTSVFLDRVPDNIPLTKEQVSSTSFCGRSGFPAKSRNENRGSRFVGAGCAELAGLLSRDARVLIRACVSYPSCCSRSQAAPFVYPRPSPLASCRRARMESR